MNNKFKRLNVIIQRKVNVIFKNKNYFKNYKIKFVRAINTFRNI